MFIRIDRTDKESLTKQIYTQIKTLILNGEIEEGFRLPSSRKLALELKVSRTTINEVYEMLISEGYTVSKPGSGNYVSPSISIKRPPIESFEEEVLQPEDQGYKFNFKSGLPSLESFPKAKWLKCYRDALSDARPNELGYDVSNGVHGLRVTLSKYVLRSRGIKCSPNQIIITTGAVQGINLLFSFLKHRQGALLLEDPVNKTIQEMHKEMGLEGIYQSVDYYGLNPESFPEDRDIAAIFTTPSHQFPMGGSLPISKRVQMINYARNKGCFIIEDDYDSEFRYRLQPVESLHELDPERVIYLGSFSKTLLPSLRMGYVIVPMEIVSEITKLKNMSDIHCPVMNQMAMQRFIELGYFEQHLSKVKKLYKKRREVLIKALKDRFNESVEIIGGETGLHIVASFKDIEFDDELMAAIFLKDVFVTRVSDHSLNSKDHMSKLILGYGNLTEVEIKEGIESLSKVILKY